MIQYWDKARLGELTEGAIRAQHLPAKNYRISKYNYAPGTRARGIMRAGRVYVLAGECAYTFHKTLRIAAGQLADLPHGEFVQEVIGPEAFQSILVWELPLWIIPSDD